MKETNIKVAVIGAGAAGLTATKRLAESNNGFECVTFERSDSVGGTWVYTDHIGKDEYGLPVHSSMYQGLRTNLPKEIMSLPDFPHVGQSEASYVTSQEVLRYFEDYADHFELKKYIKFHHHVNEIAPIANGRWKIKVTDLKREKDSVYHFDAVIVCIGNYSNPVYPNLKGVENFKGTVMHSHDYKKSSQFKGMNVLVVGAGSSGLDITNQVSNWANEVYLSHHSVKARNIDFPDNVIQKPDIKEVASNGEVVFEDESAVQVDTIIYCTDS